MFDVAAIFQNVMAIVKSAPKAVATASHFGEMVHAVLPIFKSGQQDELKSALQAARDRSDAAEADFVKASRGQ